MRNHYIARCEKDKKYDEALKVIEESILLDSGHRGLIVDYANKKKEIYLIQGNMEAYKKQMWDIVLKHEVGDIDSYKELRNLYTKDEWKEKREIIFKQLPKYAHVERLYKEEKLYDRLLEYVINTDGMYGLQEYAGILKDIYPKEILDKYVVELNKYAIYSGDRKKYRDIVAVLNYMKAIAGGIEVVSEIVEQWKIKYRNRPAMMDELSKIIMK